MEYSSLSEAETSHTRVMYRKQHRNIMKREVMEGKDGILSEFILEDHLIIENNE